MGIARQIASGLQAAHEAGVVHRDLKPANIMVDAAGHALILDFGIARLESAAQREASGGTGSSGTAAHSGLMTDGTLSGTIVGTLEYMAPEQAKAGDVDRRADIYAFGLILRDLLVGVRPSNNPFEDLQERIEKGLPPIASVDASLPSTLDAIVTRCTQIDRAARYQSVDELLVDLNSLDAEGHPLPKVRALSVKWVASAAAVFVALLAGAYWLAFTRQPPKAPPAVSVLVADFENPTKDASFTGSVEEALTMGIEGASFVSTYKRDDARKLAEQLKLGSRIDEKTARLVSTREGINVILAGTIEPRASGYTVSVKAVDPANGKVLGTAEETAQSRGDVLKAIAMVASDIRGVLGDTTSQSARLAAAEAVTTGSLEALGYYSRAQDLLYNSKDEEAIVLYKQAIEKDPNFGRAYSGLAISSQNLGRREEALDAWNKAVSLVGRMTDREKYRTLGNYYIAVPRNYEKAIENLSTLVRLYPYDRGGHVNIAISYFYLRNFTKALEHGRRSVEIAPKDVMNRANYALYAMYAGDFATAATQAAAVIKQDPSVYRMYLPIAMAALAKPDVEAATAAYEAMAGSGAPGASLANLGLADLALYQGRFTDAERLLTGGIKIDEQRRSSGGAASKYAALAEAYLGEGKRSLAVSAAERAMKVFGPTAPAVPPARVLMLAGKPEGTRALAGALGEDLQPELRAYGKLLEGELALHERRFVSATEAFLAAQKLADLWWARLGLGTAYVEAGHAAEALGELQGCEKRRGEATAILLDDVPSIRYLAPAYYWLGRAQEGSGEIPGARTSYEAYVTLRSAASGDPQLGDARQRLASLPR
jgi:tetratricopeptide (TPR) repeat protein